MAISTTNPDGNTPKQNLTKREKREQMYQYHKPVLDALGVTFTQFIPKAKFKHKDEYVMGFFDSEMEKKQDIYLEICTMDGDVETAERDLYILKFNHFYKEEYDKTEPHPTSGQVRYLIPVSELRRVEPPPPPAPPKADPEPAVQSPLFNIDQLPNPAFDAPIAEMTIKDLYAILQNKPVSDKPWLNDVINRKR